MKKRLNWIVASLFALAVLVPLIPFAANHDSGARQSAASARQSESMIVVPNPGTGLWSDLRREVSGTSQVRGIETGVLINSTGDDWRMFRMEQLIPYGGYLIGGVLILILVFYLIRGRIDIEHGRSDEVVFRFSIAQRITHWFMGGLFILLAVTGLVLLFGRHVMIPVFGAEGFSIVAAASKEIHNLFGPLFPLSIIMMLVLYGAQNIYEKGDLRWLLKGGGFFGGEHASAGRFNMGEKIFFWLTMAMGIAISVSGLVLNFPLFEQGRDIMGLAHLVHGIVAVVFIAIACGHIYMATLGTEGTLDAMTSGYVDKNWARMHHDRWAEEVESQPADSRRTTSSIEAVIGGGH